ncbi:nuclear receptor coactivator 5-like [Glossina fuscipes fuscipes]
MTELNETNSIIHNPNFSNSRLFIGNLPPCTKEELEGIFLPYGKVFGSLMRKNIGFVQMKCAENAKKAASSLNNNLFKGNIITVRKGATPRSGAGPSLPKPTESFNDCEILAMDTRNTEYAEMVEERLKLLHLKVDVLFPNAGVPLGKVLSTIAGRGCLYAILINRQNEKHGSITLNILHGQQFEHRNMPIDDAIKLIDADFRRTRRGILANSDAAKNRSPQSTHIKPGTIPKTLPEGRHSDPMQTLLKMLANNAPLTVSQYDRIIKYLQERRTLQMKVELVDAGVEDVTSVTAVVNTPDPEIALQKKMIEILSKPSVTEVHYNLLYPTLEAVKKDAGLLDLLKDVKVQKALDSLMDTDLGLKVEKWIDF